VVFGERGQRSARIEDVVEIGKVDTLLKRVLQMDRGGAVEHRRHQRGKTPAAPNPAEAIAHRRTSPGFTLFVVI
jgi:hypothetical protein